MRIHLGHINSEPGLSTIGGCPPGDHRAICHGCESPAGRSDLGHIHQAMRHPTAVTTGIGMTPGGHHLMGPWKSSLHRSVALKWPYLENSSIDSWISFQGQFFSQLGISIPSDPHLTLTPGRKGLCRGRHFGQAHVDRRQGAATLEQLYRLLRIEGTPILMERLLPRPQRGNWWKLGRWRIIK